MNMTTLLLFSVFWVINGILGLFGIQRIPEKYKGTDFEKEYKRFHGIVWLLLGIPMFVFWLVIRNVEIQNRVPYLITLVIILLPGIIYEILLEIKYRKLLKK